MKVTVDCRRKRFFAIACLGKKFFIRTFEVRELRILNLVVIDWVLELSKSNQTEHVVSTVSVECKAKKFML